MSSVYDEFKLFFNPELRRRKEAATNAARELERRKRQEALVAEVGALRASPVVQDYRKGLLLYSEAVFPSGAMDAAGAYWYRRGLEQAVSMLDESLAAAEE